MDNRIRLMHLLVLMLHNIVLFNLQKDEKLNVLGKKKLEIFVGQDNAYYADDKVVGIQGVGVKLQLYPKMKYLNELKEIDIVRILH